MSFKKFTSLKQRSINKISITKSKTFNFPTKFYEDNKLFKYKYVVLYYDSDRGAIGLQFTNNEEEDNKFTLQKNNRGYGGFISATSFFKVNDIDTNKHKGRYDWKIEKLEDVGKLYVIELKDGQESPASENESAS